MPGHFSALAAPENNALTPGNYVSPSFYEEQRKKREAAIARGEDPYAEFKARVLAREQGTFVGKMKRRFSKDKAREEASRIRALTKEEEEEAKARDGGMRLLLEEERRGERRASVGAGMGKSAGGRMRKWSLA